jgi:Predicted nucleoside-diphosphate sugar epimerase
LEGGFSVEVCKAWEKKFAEQNLSCRKVLLRTSIVLGNQDGAFTRLMNLTTFGLGGYQGNGMQRISWIHERDLVRIIEWIIEHEEISGTYNAASPDPVPNRIFMKTLRAAMKIPVGIRTPAWLLQVGAWLIGTETELVLKSRWVVPSKLLAQGFQFNFPTLESAIKDLVQNK